jgi:hypothetical protein
MKKILFNLVALIALCAFAFTGNAQEAEEIEAYFNEMEAKYTEAPDDKAKLELCKEVLAKYPESDYTVMILNMAKWHSTQLDQMNDFIALAEKIQGQVEDARTK